MATTASIPRVEPLQSTTNKRSVSDSRNHSEFAAIGRLFGEKSEKHISKEMHLKHVFDELDGI